MSTTSSRALAQSLTDATYLLVQTRTRDGTWVPTPVHLAVAGDRVYFRTYAKAGKPKRLRNFPQVRVGASTMRGRPTGPVMTAQARSLQGDEARTAARLLARKHPVLHGALIPLAHKAMRTSTLHYELTGFRLRR